MRNKIIITLTVILMLVLTGAVITGCSSGPTTAISALTIAPGKVAGATEPIPENFWTGELPSMAAKAWEHLNPLGRQYYAATVRPILEGGSFAKSDIDK